MNTDEEIDWERNHPITHSMLQTLARDAVRLSKPQRDLISRVVGKMETDLNESREAQFKLRNHIIWHIEKNKQNPAYGK
jgi:hypothetical protein